MSDKENDPPLAGKPKVSSLTDFELKALRLQKEGKGDEVQKEIEAKGLVKELPKEDDKLPSTAASVEDIKVYENIIQKINNPIPFDKVPAKYRAQIEEGLAMLKTIVDDKEMLKELRRAHEAAFKHVEEKTQLKQPVLPEEFRSIKIEKKEEPKESGDVSKVEVEEAKKEPEKVKILSPSMYQDKLLFINDIKSPAAEMSRPKMPEPEITKAPETKEPEVPATNNVSSFNLMPTCPHCGWDLKRNDPTEVSDDDRRDFVQSILGNIRFRKTYNLFGGKYKIVFRALTSKESDLAFRQIVIDGQRDLNDKAIGGTDFYWRNLQAYRMAMALESITSESFGALEVPSLDAAEIESAFGRDMQSKLPMYLSYVLDTFLPLESTRSVIGHSYFEFQALCDKLQVMAESPNFWTAIE